MSKGITTLNKREKQKINLLFIQNFNGQNLDFIVLTEIGSDTHMTSTLGVRGRRVQGKNEILLDVGGWGVRECSRRPIFIFFIKENWICAMTRHHAEQNINIVYC